MSDGPEPRDPDAAEAAAQRRSRIIIAAAVVVLLMVAVSVYFSMGAGLGGQGGTEASPSAQS